MAKQQDDIFQTIEKYLKVNVSEYRFEDKNGKKITKQEFALQSQSQSFDVDKENKVIRLKNKEKPVDVSHIVGQKLPHQNFKSTAAFKSFENYQGKPLFLSFYFSECGPCIEEVPLLNKVKDNLKEKYHFVAVTFDPLSKVKKFSKDHDFHWDTIYEAHKLLKALEVKSFPAYYVIDKAGYIKKVKTGLGSDSTVDKFMDWIEREKEV
ncbi:MAG: TlpA disulfide reductase family protein [Pseudomonadota bacterium]